MAIKRKMPLNKLTEDHLHCVICGWVIEKDKAIEYDMLDEDGNILCKCGHLLLESDRLLVAPTIREYAETIWVDFDEAVAEDGWEFDLLMRKYSTYLGGQRWDRIPKEVKEFAEREGLALRNK